jgi:hypothetical protein
MKCEDRKQGRSRRCSSVAYEPNASRQAEAAPTKILLFTEEDRVLATWYFSL